MKSIVRIILVVIGTISLVLGIMGIILPVLPTTPFLLLSAACYLRGSKRLYQLLISNKYVGKYIKDYREGRGIPKRAKIYALVLLWPTIGFTVIFVIPLIWAKLLLIGIAVVVTIHINNIKTALESRGEKIVRIYLTRHGETEWNKEGKMQGWKDSALTEKGIENAKSLGENLKHINFDRIYCSPLGRALDTAKYIRGDKDTEIIINEGLKEMGFGIWEGMEHHKVEELYPVHRSNFWNKPHLYESVEGGESFQELFSRVKNVLDEVINSDSGENILLVSHTVVIKAIYAIVKNYSLEDFWNPPFLYDTSLTIIEAAGKEIKIVLEADTSHLNQLDLGEEA
jgi:broad specificity phosphatase PhoE/uncharacterized membrane protein YbaN (DUF454 family)